MIYVFTSAAWNYLPKARILAQSIRKFLPPAKVVLALPDALTDDVDIGQYGFDEVLPVADVLCGVDNQKAWIFSHDIVSLATAIKPFVLCRLLERPDCEAVLYFDPDIEIFSPLDDLVGEFERNSVLLTPHITEPEGDDDRHVISFELCTLQHGVFNFGFVGVRNSEVGRRYAKWWRARCRRFCYDDIPNGIFTDQKWNDLVPAIFPEVGILRDARFNMAAWNDTTRRMTRGADGTWSVNGKPLGFYHFTGIDSGAHEKMVREFSLAPDVQLKFVRDYQRRMHEAAKDPLCQRPWAFACFSDGAPIDSEMRKYVREDSAKSRMFADPFDVGTAENFRAWYCRTVRRPRTSGPLRAFGQSIRSSRVYTLLKKTKRSLAEVGVRQTLRKIGAFLTGTRETDLQQQALLSGVSESLHVDAEVLDRVFCPDDSHGTETATVIVPVYNGLSHLKRLMPSLVANTPGAFPILVVDDASSDSGVSVYLEGIVRQNVGRIKVVTNDKNLGFVKSVNKAIGMTEGHVILLNSDTEVPPGWTDLLMRRLKDHIASVTPFSNAAALMSVPTIQSPNRWLLEKFSIEELNGAFLGLTLCPELLKAPVGVGFCMLMNRKAINKVGLFDEKNFGKGYGEEADWCVRAFEAGFENIVASDLFVAHWDGGSFSESQKTKDALAHEKIFSRLHPDFHGRHYLPHFAEIKPCWDLARDLAMLRLLTHPSCRPILIIANSLTGGSDAYLANYREDRSRTVIFARPAHCGIVLTVCYGEYERKMCVRSISLLLDRGFITGLTEVIVNHLLKWELYFGREAFSVDVYERIVDELVALKHRTGCRLTFLFHDFFSICPRYVLLNAAGTYCQPGGDVAGCSGCLSRLGEFGIDSPADIRRWRDSAARLFDACDELRFFSESSRRIVGNVLKLRAESATVVPHRPLADFKPLPIAPTKELTIGVVGGINLCKGADFIDDFARFLQKHDPSARIVIIGAVDHVPYPENVIVHGAYRHEELPELILRYGVNVGFVSSICPETFSYVVQELMQMELPIACFNLGAQAERVAIAPRGAVIPEISVSAAYETIRRLHADKN